MTEPKTWTEEEITAVIKNEITTTRADYHTHFGRAATPQELAENVYAQLADRGLLEHTP